MSLTQWPSDGPIDVNLNLNRKAWGLRSINLGLGDRFVSDNKKSRRPLLLEMLCLG